MENEGREEQDKKNTVRIPQFDLLRVIACILVLLVHVSAQWLKKGVVPGSASVIFAQSCNILAFSGVALFVMLSGALALRRAMSVREALTKRFLHYVILYELWRVLYYIFYVIRSGQAADPAAWKKYVLEGFTTLGGHYHLWYLPMIAMIFLLVPLIREGAGKLSNCLLYLGISFFVAILFPTVMEFEFRGKPRLEIVSLPFLSEYFTGYLGYFILGHVLYRWREYFTGRRRIILCGAGVFSLILACILSAPRVAEDGDVWYGFATPLNLFTFLTATAIFLAVTGGIPVTEKEKGAGVMEKKASFPAKVADASFGIYLLHPAVLEILTELWPVSSMFKPWIGIPCLLAALYLLTLLIVMILMHIPGIRRCIR